MSPARKADAPRRNGLRRLGRALLVGFVGLSVACMAIWCTLFLWYSDLSSAPLRAALAGLFAVGTLVSFVLIRWKGRALLVFLLVFAGLVAWFLSIEPSNHRDWSPEVARLAAVTVKDDRVEIRNIRNFEYRSETDFTPRYYDRSFDLKKLRSVDLICVHWGSPAIAHIMVSFGFEGDDYLAFSIEMRKERGEAGSMLRSFFRKYELICVVADERDLIRLRTNFRVPPEQVYVYRTRLPIGDQRKLFLSYAAMLNELARQPEWYNTLENNCTTGVLAHTRAYKARARYTWKVFLSGYAAEYGYDLGMLDTSMSFDQLRDGCLVNAKAVAAGQGDDFSVRIREDIPKPEPYSLSEFESHD